MRRKVGQAISVLVLLSLIMGLIVAFSQPKVALFLFVLTGLLWAITKIMIQQDELKTAYESSLTLRASATVEQPYKEVWEHEHLASAVISAAGRGVRESLERERLGWKLRPADDVSGSALNAAADEFMSRVMEGRGETRRGLSLFAQVAKLAGMHGHQVEPWDKE